MGEPVTYSSYLDLEKILNAQHPASDAHDEMLFFIVHQSNELWLKLCLHEKTQDWPDQLNIEMGRSSLYDLAMALLARRGFLIDRSVTERDLSRSYDANRGAESAWAEIYRDLERHWDLYELAQMLEGLEHHFQRWRFGYLKTVERINGFKRGTGGTPGAPHLVGVLKQAFFPELLSVRTAI